MRHHVHACHREASLRRHHVSHRGQHHGKTHRTRSRTPLSPAQGARPTHDEQLTVRRSRTRRETCQDKPKATRGTSGARSASESHPGQRQGQCRRRGCTAERVTETKGQCRWRCELREASVAPGRKIQRFPGESQCRRWRSVPRRLQQVPGQGSGNQVDSAARCREKNEEKMNGDTSVKRNSRAEKDVEKEDSIITADGQGRTENLRFDVSLFIWAAEGRLERQRKRTDAIAARPRPSRARRSQRYHAKLR